MKKLDIFIRLYDRDGKVRQFSMEYFRCSVGAVYYYQVSMNSPFNKGVPVLYTG